MAKSYLQAARQRSPPQPDLLHNRQDDIRQRRDPIRPPRPGPYGWGYLRVLPRGEHPGHWRSFYRWKLSDPRLVHGWLDRCERPATCAAGDIRWDTCRG